jgi:hypothetical protein
MLLLSEMTREQEHITPNYKRLLADSSYAWKLLALHIVEQ